MPDIPVVLYGAALRRPELTATLLRALFEEWAAHGYAATSLERVAERAGVAKATLYRRWKSKREMAQDALGSIAITITVAPSEGSLENDLVVLLRSYRRLLRHPLARRIIPDLHAEQARGSELNAILRTITSQRRDRVQPLIEAAISRGELPADVDRGLASDLLAAPLYWRLIATGGRSDARHINLLARVSAAALRASVE